LSRPLGACHPRLSMLGRLRLYLATFGRVFSFILLLVPGIAETLTSLPAAHPLADGPESPLVRSRPALAGRHLHRRLRPSSMGDPFASRGIGPAKGKKVAHPTSYPFAEHRIYELTCSSPPRADGRFAAIAVFQSGGHGRPQYVTSQSLKTHKISSSKSLSHLSTTVRSNR
jgi:hypothetical protein